MRPCLQLNVQRGTFNVQRSLRDRLLLLVVAFVALVARPAPAATNRVPVRALILLLPSTYAGETYSGMTFDPRADGTLYLWPCANCAGAGGGTTLVTTVTVLGVTSLNGLTNATQTFAIGLGGADFNISSSGSAHTFNLPTASAAARGALSSSDWSAFNGKASLAYVDTAASNRVVVAAGANVTVTPSGAGGVMTFTVASTGGGGGSGPLTVLPANAHLNGASGPAFTTNLLGNLAVVLTNLTEGTIYSLYVSNPATYTVSFNLAALNWVQFQDGSSPTATTNGWTQYQFLKTGTVTNGWVSGREKPPVAGAHLTITETANSHIFAADDQIAPLTINNVANQAAVSNIMHLQVWSNATYSVNTGRDQLGGSFSQGTNYVDFDISSVKIMPMTNDMRFAHSTNRCPTGVDCYKKVQYLLFAGATNRIFNWNANWKAIGTTNNPPIMLEANCWMRVDVECWGPNETNVFLLAAKQNFPAP